MFKGIWNRFKKKYLAYCIAYSAKWAIRLLLATCKVEVKGVDKFKLTAKNRPCIIILWHNRLALIAEVLNKHAPDFVYRCVISNSRDGEPLAIFTNSYTPARTLRVSHDARHHALSQMVGFLKKKEILIITPDGPRGPRYRMKKGVYVAAKEVDADIVPFSWSASRFWQLKTWDKMIFPKPFSTVVISIGDALARDPNLDMNDQLGILSDDLCKFDDSLCNEIQAWPL